MKMRDVDPWLEQKYFRVQEGKDASSTDTVIVAMNSFIKHALGVHLSELRPILVNYEPSDHVLDSDLDQIQAFMEMKKSDQGLKLIEWSEAEAVPAEFKRRAGEWTLIFRCSQEKGGGCKRSKGGKEVVFMN
jgi:hypothetical protein